MQKPIAERSFSQLIGEFILSGSHEARAEIDRRFPASPTPHAHPRDEPAVLAHEARGTVGDEEREPEGGPGGDDVG